MADADLQRNAQKLGSSCSDNTNENNSNRITNDHIGNMMHIHTQKTHMTRSQSVTQSHSTFEITEQGYSHTARNISTRSVTHSLTCNGAEEYV